MQTKLGVHIVEALVLFIEVLRLCESMSSRKAADKVGFLDLYKLFYFVCQSFNLCGHVYLKSHVGVLALNWVEL